MTAISFKVTKHEFQVISDIASRAMGLLSRAGDPTPKKEVQMDVTAVHANGCPLRLEELRDANDFSFSHDIFGIRRHLNRETGQLEDCFLPRFAQPRRTAS